MSSKNVGSKSICAQWTGGSKKLIISLVNNKLKERFLLPRIVNFSVIAIHTNKPPYFLSFHLLKLKKESPP